ncbi:MAG TPA: hypothetical protein VHM26_11325 [Chitinophagaceae bacterium]|jgi:hypothetical protein|nr:hypothetical protein [Chitinophagaceae bacterium]
MRYKFFICLFISAVISVTGFAQKDSVRFSGTTRFDKQYRFFFKGETHEYRKENANSLFALLNYLHKANNVRYLVMEIGPDQAFIINRFLQTGNVQLLEDNKPYLGKDLWMQVYTFNNKKAEKDKIKVLGFDFNRRLFTTRALRMMIQNKVVSSSQQRLRDAIDDVTRWDTVIADAASDRGLEKDLSRLQDIVLKNDSSARSLLVKEYTAFIDIVFNKTPATSQVKRDRAMVAQFTDKLPGLTSGNFLFNYGIAHVFLNGAGAGNILSEKKEFDKQVCTIYSYYLDKDKSKFLRKIEEDLPSSFRDELDQMKSNTLIDLSAKEIYPAKFKKTQWVMTISISSP